MLREGDLRCSFCSTSSSAVSKLIASPGEDPKSYICDQCVQTCASILEDDRLQIGHPVAIGSDQEASPLLTHPLTPQLLSLIEVWIRRESLGESSADELAEVRRLALRIVG